MNITYEHTSDLEPINAEKKKNDPTLESIIDQRIKDLQNEQAEIVNIFIRLSKFLHVNAIVPFNDESVQYLRHMIRIERMKNDRGIRNNDVTEGLSNIIIAYDNAMDTFKKKLTDEKDVPDVEGVFILFGGLASITD